MLALYLYYIDGFAVKIPFSWEPPANINALWHLDGEDENKITCTIVSLLSICYIILQIGVSFREFLNQCKRNIME